MRMRFEAVPERKGDMAILMASHDFPVTARAYSRPRFSIARCFDLYFILHFTQNARNA